MNRVILHFFFYFSFFLMTENLKITSFFLNFAKKWKAAFDIQSYQLVIY
jgi:hypothetical protein